MVLPASVRYAVGPLLTSSTGWRACRRSASPPSTMVAGALVTRTLLLCARRRTPPAPGRSAASLLASAPGDRRRLRLVDYTLIREVGPGRGALVAYLAPPFAVLSTARCSSTSTPA